MAIFQIKECEYNMIIHLKGKISEIAPFKLHLDVNGVGYLIIISLAVYEEYKLNVDETIFIHTRMIFREDSQTIYGFLDTDEAFLFDFLCNLQGIGAKLAINLISFMGANELISCLYKEDYKALTNVPRVGKAKAEKIVFEAKGKKKKLEQLQQSKTRDLLPAFIEPVEEALLTLGFQKKEIDNATLKIDKLKNLPEKKIENIQLWIKLYLSLL